MIYWLTGQPGAGKTTLAKWLEAQFAAKGKTIVIDGDDIRAIFDNKDYSEAGRKKNIELAQNIAKFLHYKGNTVIVSLVSPYKDQRDSFKETMKDSIKEIYVHTSNIRGREQFHVQDYGMPTENFIDIDTTNRPEFETAQELTQKLSS
jgi:adenylylsulfate kinase-like enzyme